MAIEAHGFTRIVWTGARRESHFSRRFENTGDVVTAGDFGSESEDANPGTRAAVPQTEGSAAIISRE